MTSNIRQIDMAVTPSNINNITLDIYNEPYTYCQDKADCFTGHALLGCISGYSGIENSTYCETKANYTTCITSSDCLCYSRDYMILSGVHNIWTSNLSMSSFVDLGACLSSVWAGWYNIPTYDTTTTTTSTTTSSSSTTSTTSTTRVRTEITSEDVTSQYIGLLSSIGITTAVTDGINYTCYCACSAASIFNPVIITIQISVLGIISTAHHLLN